ncbi:MAG TPA: 30S ribosomal protein S8 [Candidatus Thermoplasmatota archaeon]|jgi:small subunit ribosomal protein S8|nr:30S ribosomal protein S8 [Candidatus Thermoplasmatota archaeon]
MQSDPLADALVAMKNAERAGKSLCDVHPASKLLGRVLKVMQEAGYIASYEFVEDHKGGQFRVRLTGHINECGAIKPRYSVQRTDFEKWESRYLPGRDFGTLILTTTEGVVSHAQAKELGMGGKLIAFVY